MIRGGCIALGVSDFDAAVRFYSETLGLGPVSRFGDEWATVDAGGGLVIGLASHSGATDATTSDTTATVSLWSNEPLGSAVESLTAKGVSFEGPVVEEGMVQLAYFRDLDGNRLSLTNVPPSPTAALNTSEGERLPFFEHLGLRWKYLDTDSASVEIDIREDLRGPAGTLQGGVIATLVDVAAATAAAQGSGGLVATSEMTLHFLAPGRVGPVRADAELLRATSGGASVEVRVYDTGKDDRLMTVALAAFADLSGSARKNRSH